MMWSNAGRYARTRGSPVHVSTASSSSTESSEDGEDWSTLTQRTEEEEPETDNEAVSVLDITRRTPSLGVLDRTCQPKSSGRCKAFNLSQDATFLLFNFFCANMQHKQVHNNIHRPCDEYCK